MDDAVKNRLGILRVYAELDEEHRQLLHQIQSAEIALLSLNRDFTAEEVDAIWSLIRAHQEANRRIVTLACECMIFRSELEISQRRTDCTTGISSGHHTT